MAHPKTSSSWLTWRSSSTVAVRRVPDGETADVRFVKGAVARAVRTLRERRGDVALTARVIGLTAQAISERFAAAARAACRSSGWHPDSPPAARPAAGPARAHRGPAGASCAGCDGGVRRGQRTELNERRITSSALSMSATDLTWKMTPVGCSDPTTNFQVVPSAAPSMSSTSCRPTTGRPPPPAS